MTNMLNVETYPKVGFITNLYIEFMWHFKVSAENLESLRF